MAEELMNRIGSQGNMEELFQLYATITIREWHLPKKTIINRGRIMPNGIHIFYSKNEVLQNLCRIALYGEFNEKISKLEERGVIVTIDSKSKNPILQLPTSYSLATETYRTKNKRKLYKYIQDSIDYYIEEVGGLSILVDILREESSGSPGTYDLSSIRKPIPTNSGWYRLQKDKGSFTSLTVRPMKFKMDIELSTVYVLFFGNKFGDTRPSDYYASFKNQEIFHQRTNSETLSVEEDLFQILTKEPIEFWNELICIDNVVQVNRFFKFNWPQIDLHYFCAREKAFDQQLTRRIIDDISNEIGPPSYLQATSTNFGKAPPIYRR